MTAESEGSRARSELGTLVLVATPIGNLGDLSPRAVSVLGAADVVCCEDTRHTGRLLAHAQTRARRLVSLHGHNEARRVEEVLALLADGATVAVVSDAGTPLVSDPGERLVAGAIALGATVTTVPGPFAGLTALVLSGFSLDRWRFEGFLPRKGAERTTRLNEIAASRQVTVMYEAPTRLVATLADLAACCGLDRRIVIARELTKLHEEVRRLTLRDAPQVVAGHEPRGEHVIVVDGASPEHAASDTEIRVAMVALREAGLGRRDAMKAVEVLLGVPHREAYAASIASGRSESTDLPVTDGE